jgi:hypothetical protein
MVTEVHDQVAGLLGDPSAGRVSDDPGDVDTAAAVLDDHEHLVSVLELDQVVGGWIWPASACRCRS